MFKKSFRLTKNKEYDFVFKNGKGCFGDLLGIKFVINSLQYNRFGIIISNKVNKSAVKRNLIKRRLKEAIKLKNKEVRQGFDIVIIALPAISGKNFEEIEESINFVLKKARLADK